MATSEISRNLQQLNVLWIMFSFLELYFIARGTTYLFLGLANILLTFVLVWYAGQYAKNRKLLDEMVVGEKAKGQWER